MLFSAEVFPDKFGMFICLTDGTLLGLVPKVALGPNAKFAMGRWPIQY